MDPGAVPRHRATASCSCSAPGNRSGDKPYPSGTYNWMLREFSNIVKITDSKGRPVGLSHTHRFRHTKLTRLAELGLPIHVLQRYAGHATPTMSMHYIAQREEHAEQAFLATAKLRADGTRVSFSREDHDSLHLFDRADRFLPHGWCLLPPLQTCDKGNACLTCSVFVTDQTHHTALQRQLAETEAADRPQHHRVPAAPRPPHARGQRLARPAQRRTRRPDPAAGHHGRQPRTSGAGRRLRRSPRHQRPGPAHPRPHPPSKDPAMTDARERRIATLTAAAKAKSQAKTDAAEQAIRRLVKRGEPVTFQAVQREAGVSHAFLYGHPDLRGRIEHLRAQNRPPTPRAGDPGPRRARSSRP